METLAITDVDKSVQKPYSKNANRIQTRTITSQFFRIRRGQQVAISKKPPIKLTEPVRRPARVALMLALAHHLEKAIDSGKVTSRAELARVLGLDRARITQLMNLMLLAPDIQEQILFLESINGVEPVTERQLRKLVQILDWTEQRRAWEDFC